MKLSDEQAYDRLVKARQALDDDECETVVSNSALEAARNMLTMLQVAMVKSMDKRAED